MAIDCFLKLDGIKGEAQDATHKDEIDIYSWSWAVSQRSSMATGGGGGTGKAQIRDITITKRYDKATTALWGFVLNGKHIAEGLLTCRKAGEKPLEFLKIKLQDILVTDLIVNSAREEIIPMETFKLSFAKVWVDYFEQKADGSGKPAGAVGWDVKANQKL